ncbi:MAG: radical SAM protein, partial [Deltaproteobacteria bacterium]|nr:radical SAM protein [Deltaproteobacteria bacterium]
MWIVCLVLAVMAGADRARAASVIREGGKTTIQDLRGERWDVTQAETLGFDPGGFQYGIGRNAFTPLADARVRKLTLTGGEPFAHPDLIEIVAQALAREMTVTVCTNGTLIDEPDVKALA